MPEARREAVRNAIAQRSAKRRAADLPGTADDWVEMAVHAFFAGDPDTALWCALEAYGLAPDDPYVLSQVGFFLLDRGLVRRGKDFLLRAYRVDSAEDKFPATLFSLGFVYEELGDYARSAYYYQQLLGQNPRNPYFRYTLGRVYAKAGQVGMARPLLEHAAEALPDIPEIQELVDGLPSEPDSDALPDLTGAPYGLDLLMALNRCNLDLQTDPDLQEAAAVSGEMASWDAAVQDRFSQSSDTAMDCLNACYTLTDPAALLCEAGCDADWCGRDSSIAHDGAGRYMALFADWYRYQARATARWTACAFDAYFQYFGEASRDVRTLAEKHIWAGVAQREQGWVDVWENDVRATVGAYRDYAAASCEAASASGEAAAAVDPLDLLYGLAGGDMDLCGWGVCFHWDAENQRTTVTVNGAGVFTEVSMPVYSSRFTATIGSKVWSKGPAEVNVFVRFDSEEGVTGVEVEGKVSGPVVGDVLNSRVVLTPH